MVVSTSSPRLLITAVAASKYPHAVSHKHLFKSSVSTTIAYAANLAANAQPAHPVLCLLHVVHMPILTYTEP